MLKLLKYLKKYWFFAMLAPLFMLCEVAADLILANYMEKMIDLGVNESNMQAVAQYGVMMLLIVLVGVACGVLSGVFANIASQRFANDLRKDVFQKIMHLSYDQTDTFSTGSLVTRVTNDITAVQNMVAMAIRMLVRSFGMFILGIIFTLSISSRFGFILLIALPLELGIMIVFMKKAFPLFGMIQQKLDGVNTVVHENLTGARVVKAFSKENYEFNRFVKTNDDYTSVLLKVNKMMAFIMPLFMIIIYLATLSIYAIGGSSIFDAFNVNGEPALKIGQITQAITYISMICMSFLMLGMTFTQLARSVASAKRINEVLDCPLEIIDGSLDVQTLQKQGEILFNHVSFAYKGSHGNILDDLNFSIHKGETIAIVGATGCGKTTLVNLITRFYDVSQGSIEVDGVNVKEYKQFDLRNKIAIVLQKAELFAGSVKENISWGKIDATQQEIIKASQIAQAEEFILSKKEGYDTYIEEKGSSLSGGQKQRISIARALVKKPEILIFDDATSALDLITEAKLYKAMKEEMRDTTKIVVVQRIASAQNADKILVLESGKAIAFADHQTLLTTCSVYQDIYNSQLKKEGVDNG